MFSAAERPLVDGHVGERERREGQSEPARLRREARRRVRVRREARRRVRVVLMWSGRLKRRRRVVRPASRLVNVLGRAGGPLDG